MAEITAVVGPPLTHAPSGSAMPSRMTFEEFMAWTDEDTLAEWVQGKVVMMSPSSDLHQELVEWLAAVLRLNVKGLRLGWARTAPFLMRLSAETARKPDLVFVTNEHRERIKRTHLDGPADLVIEIVSADSVGRDRGEKYYEYEQAGIPEYWLIDSRTRRAEFYQLQGAYYQPALPDADGIYRSRALRGFWLNVNWLQAETLPAVEDVLLDVGGQAYAAQLIDRLRRRGYLAGG